MAKSIISWTDYTFNPWMGCTKISPGCAHCYAEVMASGRMGRKGLWGKDADRQVTSEAYWRQPIKWNEEAAAAGTRHRVFVGSMCDWAESHPQVQHARSRLWGLIYQTPNLDWLLLTKRADDIRFYLPQDSRIEWRHNIWIGVSIESNDFAWRGNYLRLVPAAVRFVSYEPALGPLDELDLTGIDWVIYGGESGPKYRGHDLAWPRAMRDRCRDAGVAFFYKQSPGVRQGMGPTLDGETIHEYPTPRTVGAGFTAGGD